METKAQELVEASIGLAEVSQIATIISSLIIIGIGFQVYIAYRQLKSDHERSRREKAVELLVEWNRGLKSESSLSRKIIEVLNEEQCREIMAESSLHLPSKLADKLSNIFPDMEKNTPKDSGSEDNAIFLSASQSSKLRWYAITYLNSLEFILVAWQYSIVDRKIIEDEFSFLFRPAEGHEALKKFRDAAGGGNSFPAIEVFANHIEEKRRKKLINKSNVE